MRRQVVLVAVAAMTAGGALTAVPGAVAGSSSTWVETQQYAVPGAAFTACFGDPVPGTGGGCFGLNHPYTRVLSIVVSDQAAPGIDGDWQIVNSPSATSNQVTLATGPICNGKAQNLPTSIPAGASELFVAVGNPADASACGNAGTPVATTGTITVTYGLPFAGAIRSPSALPGCPGSLTSAHPMGYLSNPKPSVQPPPVTLPCGTPGPPVAGEPAPVNMAYFGGHVQKSPHIYLVLWGWHAPNAFRDKPTGNNPSYDPDGVAARMISFLSAIGGTHWAGVQTQYYETDSAGHNHAITNPNRQFYGAWWDNIDPIHDNLSVKELALEAQRAAAHFGVTGAALKDANFVIAQPQNYSDSGFQNGGGYCAFHDYTEPSPYPYTGVKAGISYTNMPYVLDQGASCGENAVNSDSSGVLDGVTIVLGHEVEETVTDPGAEDTVGGKTIGGWYDYASYENGDKCAWVGYLGLPGASTAPIPGAIGTMTGHDGRKYPVQALWSNNAAGGLGYCAGTNELPF